MKLKFEVFFRIFIALLVLTLGWSVWRAAAAEGSTVGVQLTAPEDGARFNPGATILLRANIGENTAPVTHVEFFAGRRALGVSTNPPYSLLWTNVPAGDHRLSARAHRASGEIIESPRVVIHVYAPMATPAWIQRLTVSLPLLSHRIWGNELWKYLFSLIYIFLAFYVSKLLDFLTRVWLKKWAERTATRFDDLFLDLLNGPVKVVAFMIFLRIGLNVFQWPVLVQSIVAKGFTILIAASLTYMVLKFVDLVMGYWRQRVKGETVDRSFDDQLFPMLRKSLKVFVVVVAALVTLANVGVDVTAAIASLSIGGLALGLAAQDTLANLFGAVSVFVDKPFKVGDRIRLESVDGTVESIGMRSTRVRNGDGHLITVPNKTMGSATITNVSLRPNIKTTFNVGLTYDTPAGKVRRALEILNEIYSGHPKTRDVVIGFNQFADSSLNIQVVHWWDSLDHKEYLAGMQEMNLALKERFDTEGISFAFPSQTVYVKQDSDWKFQREESNGRGTEKR